MALEEFSLILQHPIAHLCCDGGVWCQAVAGAYRQCMLSSGNFGAEVQSDGGVARQEFYPDLKQKESNIFVQTAWRQVLYCSCDATMGTSPDILYIP